MIGDYCTKNFIFARNTMINNARISIKERGVRLLSFIKNHDSVVRQFLCFPNMKSHKEN